VTIDYDGRQFRKLAAADGVTARYHQEDDLVWADFAGGPVRRGSVNGICGPDGTLHLAYTMVLDGGDVIAGSTVNTPEHDAEGGLLLREEWERYTPHAETGVSYLAEVTAPEAATETEAEQ
jgi:hypothetical protein